MIRGTYTAPTLGRLADGLRPAEHVPGQLEIEEAARQAALSAADPEADPTEQDAAA